MSRRITGALAALAVLLVGAAPAAAGPVATSDSAYQALGRVFPDPMGGCQAAGSPCDPSAEGNVPAQTFVGIGEFHDGLAYMNQRADWQRFMEVYVLDGKDGTGSATRKEVEANPQVMFPGNSLKTLEFTPRTENISAGIPTSALGREQSDLTVVRVTDESVPDAGKKRYALSLSIHGIERAGAEGGIRALEDLVTAGSTGKANAAILPAAVKAGAPTFAEALKKVIVYFTFPNPDGWRRGSFTSGGGAFQRYNGNGIDPNRDYLDIGYNFRGYSGNSEPETRAFKRFYTELLDSGKKFAAGDDLHGQPYADALSYTLLPHGQHDLGKDTRIRETAKRINRAQYEATKWSPLIQDNDQPVGGGTAGCVDTIQLGDACRKIYAQTWGSVYDTINYTTTGTLGDWFDSKAGLNADGIDNEMSFSHLDKNTVFERNTEQLHVAGNKAIIFSHIAEMLDPKSAEMIAPGRQGYVPNVRLVEKGGEVQGDAPKGTVPQAKLTASGMPDASARTVIPFTVKRGKQGGDGSADAGKDVFSGGMRIDVTTPNLQGIGSGSAKLRIECRHCDDHVGAPDNVDDDWIVVASDYNQLSLYLQAGVTSAVNRPDAFYTDKDGSTKPVEWRAVLDLAPQGLGDVGTPGPATMTVDFSSGPATDDGSYGGDAAPRTSPVNVANTDFFTDLNRFITDKQDRFEEVDPAKVAKGAQKLDGLHNLVLADDFMPGSHSTAEREAWAAKLSQWISAGGNLVMTDGALRDLGLLVPKITSSKVRKTTVYAGQVTLCTAFDDNNACTGSTLKDPLNAGVDQPGSRFNSGQRRQLYEPTPLGFAIQSKTGGDQSNARQYDIELAAFKAAGGRVTATSTDSSPRSTAPVVNRVTMGEIPLGKGKIRVAGALLPQPSAAFDHPYGLAPYAVTYTGYILACNLLDAKCPVVAQNARRGR